MLWRLMLVGRDVRTRWLPFAEIARGRLNRQGLLSHAAHLGMALAAAGDWATATRQLEMLRERAPKDKSGLLGDVAVPLIEGMQAFAGGDYRTTIARIEPLRARIVEIGGRRRPRRGPPPPPPPPRVSCPPARPAGTPSPPARESPAPPPPLHLL